MNDFVLIWTAAYIAYRYPRKYPLLARIHGHAYWFYSNEQISKSLQLPFSYPWTRCRFHRNELVSKSLQLPFSYQWTSLLILQQRADFQESTTSILVSMDTPVDSTETSWFPGVYNFHSRNHGQAYWFYSNELVSKSLQLPFSYPWTSLLILQQRAGFQESTTSILVSMDTPVDSTATSWFPRVYNFHSRNHGQAYWFYSNELISKSLQLPFSYPRRSVRQLVS
jgi:hypothetical protein